jgi:epoxyqueuosine reductase QueG
LAKNEFENYSEPVGDADEWKYKGLSDWMRHQNATKAEPSPHLCGLISVLARALDLPPY